MKTTKTSVRVTDIPAEIPTAYVPNEKLEY